MPFQIVRNDITNMQVDAIVNNAAREAARFGIRSDRAANYHADHIGTEVIYEAVSEAVCQVRKCAAPLSADWKRKIDADFKGRSK